MNKLLIAGAVIALLGCKVTVGDDQDNPAQPENQISSANPGDDSSSSDAERTQQNSSDNLSSMPVTPEDFQELAQQAASDQEVIEQIRLEADQEGAQELAAPIQETQDNLDTLEAALADNSSPAIVVQARVQYCGSLVSLRTQVESSRQRQTIVPTVADSLNTQISSNQLCQNF